MFGRSVIGAMCGLLVAAQAWAFDEGIDYTRLSLPQPTESGGKVELVEVFWYGCPHCWHLEPALDAWLKRLPDGVVFRRMPAVGGRWDAYARAFYAAQSLGQLDVFHPALFKAVHEQKRRLTNADEMAKLAGEAGLDVGRFRTAYASPAVEAKLDKAREMATRYGVDSVPTLIVNGKYRTGPGQAGDAAHMFQILDMLLRQELGTKS